MKRRRLPWRTEAMRFAPLVAATLFAAPAVAQVLDPRDVQDASPAVLLAGDDIDAMVEIMLDEGFRARRDVDGYGAPMIESAASGHTFYVYFYGCDEGGANCVSMQFKAGFDMQDGTTAEHLNEWNAAKRYASAYMDDEDDPFIDYDIVLGPSGISLDAFKRSLYTWERAVGEFKGHIGW